MKQSIIIGLVLVLTLSMSCNSSKNDPESIRKQIGEYEAQVIELKSKISDLEHQLDTLNSSQNIGKILVGFIKTEPIQFINYIDVVGNVETDLQSLISPESNGQIEKIYVQEGDYVKAGTLLVGLKTEVTDKTIKEVQNSLELAKTVYNKQKELWDQKIGSEIQYLQAKNNKESLEMKLQTLNAQLKMAQIRAPFDGHIENIFQKEGEIASPGRQVLEIVNLQKLKVTADVSEAYVSDIKEGDMAKVGFPSFSGLEIDAAVSMVGSIVNQNNRTFQIQIDIPNKDRKLKPNLISNVKLVQAVYDSAIIVPAIIIKNDAQGKKYIYVINNRDGNLIAEKRYIQTGVSYGNKTLVLKGLSYGEEIIHKGYNTVKNGSIVRVK